MLRRAAIVTGVCACLLGLLWIFVGREADSGTVSNANVVGAVAGIAALALTFLLLWPRAGTRQSSADAVTAEQAQAAVEYLAVETLRYWQIQAKDRRITTPSPAMVSWKWAGEDVAAPAELRPELLTAGVVTRLREQLYDRLDAPARVVVLGGPGAGKTTAMLLLLIDILEHRRTGAAQPVPVWLTLGGWNPQTTGLREWAATVLKRDYPGLSATVHGGPASAAELIRTGQVALFLDGLDEMPPAVQGRALELIDREAVWLRIVVTSRPAEYQAAINEGRLYRAAVIDVLAVEPEHARDFLLAEQVGERRRAWQQVADHLVAHPASVAARTLTSPLALGLARDAYAQSDPRNLLDTEANPTQEALLRRLFAQSLHLAYPNRAEHEHATRWLSWIARHMDTSRDFRWWDIPTWTPAWQRGLAFGLAAGLPGGLTVGLTFGLVGGLPGGLTDGLTVGLTGGFMGGFMAGLAGSTFATMPHALFVRRPSGRETWHLLAFGLPGGLAFGLMAGLATGPAAGFAAGLTGVLTGGFMIGLRGIWSGPLSSTHGASPSVVHRSDRRRSIAFGLAAGLAVGVTAGLMAGLAAGLTDGLAAGLTDGLIAGPMVGLTLGAGPALELMKAELVLRLRGRRVRFMPLLETALQRQVLRQAGAVYQFRHAALQDLLATHPAAEPGFDPADARPATPSQDESETAPEHDKRAGAADPSSAA